MKAPLVELLIRLRRSAVKGVMPEQALEESVRALALGGAGRGRLRDELARLGLSVQERCIHVELDGGNVEMVARFRKENVFPNVEADERCCRVSPMPRDT